MSSYNYGPDYNYTGSAPKISFIAKTGERLTTPKMVYDYLSKRIYKQDAAIKASSLFLFKHVNHFGKTRVSLFCGPTGSGKHIYGMQSGRTSFHILFLSIPPTLQDQDLLVPISQIIFQKSIRIHIGLRFSFLI